MIHDPLAIVYFGPGDPLPPHVITYHQQDAHGPDLYCGAACAQMVLFSLDQLTLHDQTVLHASNQALGSADGGGAVWFATPDGLEGTLNAERPAGYTDLFQCQELLSEDAISRKICWAIHHHRVAPVALVYGSEHWLVVTGYKADAAPADSTDTTYTIESFDIYNPWPPTPSDTATHDYPPLHGHGTDGCGNGLVAGKDQGYAREWVLYKKPGTGPSLKKYWHNDYMLPVSVGTLWDTMFIAITDVDTPPETQDVEPELDTVEETDLELIKELAARGMEEYGLIDRPDWRDALDGTVPDAPLLVERFDLDPPRRYYLVPFRNDAQNTVPVVARVDAYIDGSLTGAIAANVRGTGDRTTHFVDALSWEEVRDSLVGTTVNVNGEDLLLREDDLSKTLVWRPCAESLSFYYPFFRFTPMSANGRIEIYFRIDREMFVGLTLGAGM